ncbi:WecB/TagA/CpsF family glycosyltransferase (plasmid) [Deinococcus sp. KNUC1210]|uniref:WecB/TagA/CpsF family glycosyltransferase n=1 Tax=Deinococcus sp. KNUC1210 TaxID=2917691 RepID=UPI001EEF8D86|nr:WecB/TagA/CpsF family glycosyltransferase [Deinococcus sp. KNUC1210]ULH14138.1 WecB/TagA/CpsF family glycosyltransferase [Deinococcus sp. KNUC1210]
MSDKVSADPAAPLAASPLVDRLELLGLPLDPVTLDQALDVLSGWLTGPRSPHTVVTLNPEFIIQSRQHEAAGDFTFTHAMQKADLVTADGVGIVWAARQLLTREVPRAPGFDLSSGLMRRHGNDLSVFFLGAKPGVAEVAAQKAAEQYGVRVAGVHHGYFDTSEDVRVAEMVRDSGAGLLLTAMGAARQEIFNEYWREVLNVPVMMGVGGVLDVLAGTASLAPAWTRRLGVEWIWRVAGDRKRWNRAPRLADFARLVLQEKRRN